MLTGASAFRALVSRENLACSAQNDPSPNFFPQRHRIFTSGGWDRTDTNPVDFQWLAGSVSARASGDVLEVGPLEAPDRLTLARVAAAWPRLHGSLKAAILAIVEAGERE